MTTTAAKKKINALADAYGRDRLLFRLIDYWKPSERGAKGWATHKELTAGDIAEAVDSATWTLKYIDGEFSVRDIIKFLEKGIAYDVEVFVEESYLEYCKFHKCRQEDLPKKIANYKCFIDSII